MDKELEDAINQRINELEEENCKLQVYLNVEYSKKNSNVYIFDRDPSVKGVARSEGWRE